MPEIAFLGHLGSSAAYRSVLAAVRGVSGLPPGLTVGLEGLLGLA